MEQEVFYELIFTDYRHSGQRNIRFPRKSHRGGGSYGGGRHHRPGVRAVRGIYREIRSRRAAGRPVPLSRSWCGKGRAQRECKADGSAYRRKCTEAVQYRSFTGGCGRNGQQVQSGSQCNLKRLYGDGQGGGKIPGASPVSISGRRPCQTSSGAYDEYFKRRKACG